ncbi:hypothetical protein O2S95_002419 [Enterococcus faecium]|nr:hypothetical protein [Enterococcus faecium]
MASSDETLTTESFLFICKQVGLSNEEMQLMEVGDCLDFVQEWIDNHQEKSSTKSKNRKATQADFDAF